MASSHKTTPGAAKESFHALLRTFGLVRQVMDAHFDQFGISGAQWGVLRALHRARQEGLNDLRPTDVSARLLVRPPTVTAIIGRLVRTGLVERIASRADLRTRPLRLTPAGEALIEKGLNGHDAQIRSVMGGLPGPQLRQMAAMLQAMESHLRNLLRSQEVARRSPAPGVRRKPAGVAR
jgi:DNA-binding MarR family transcriptional regulator